MKILLVDDNQEITDMLSKFLKLKKHECIVSNDGRNGLNLIQQGKFDVVILDLAMPEFTGRDVINSLSKSGKIKEQKIILFTASSATNEEIDELIKLGAHSCIKKPIGLDELLKSIST